MHSHDIMRSHSSTARSHGGYTLHLLLVDILRWNILEGSRAWIQCGYLCTDQWNHTYANSSQQYIYSSVACSVFPKLVLLVTGKYPLCILTYTAH